MSLACFLLLSSFTSASLKRKREENVPIFSEEKSKNCSSSEIQQENPSKRQKVLNFPAKFAIADILNQFMTFNPNFQAHWKMTCKKGILHFENCAPYQANFGFDFNLKGFRNLPFHSDLKVFENFKFPNTPEGKAHALLLVFKMAELVLEVSPIHSDVMALVYDEAADLAKNENQAFEKFCKLSKFKECVNTVGLVRNFIKNDKLEDLLAFGFDLPTLLMKKASVFHFVSEEHFAENALAFSKYFSHKPEHFKLFCANAIAPGIIISLACSELPEATVCALLHEGLVALAPQQFLDMILNIAIHPLPENFPNLLTLGVID